jgi:hypothetical protein
MDFQKWIAIGKIEHMPGVSEANGRKQMAFNFLVNDRRPDANGQYVDHEMKVPVYAFDKKAELIEQYVVDGQELTLECKYLNWEANGGTQHAFVVLGVSFGFKPKGSGGNQQNNAGNFGGPPA